LPKPFFRGKHGCMSRKPLRLLLVAALAYAGLTCAGLPCAGLGTAFAAPAKHIPLPPPRPAFPDDEMLLRQSAEADALAQAQAQVAAANALHTPWGALEPQRMEMPQVQASQVQASQVQAYAPEAQPILPPQSPPHISVVPQAAANHAANYPADYPAIASRRDDEDVPGFGLAEKTGLAELTRKYARQHGVPLALLHRIIMRESKYCPRLVNRRYYGLMQITPATARSMGYHGAPNGLLDPETNLAFAAPYLANAWALADGDMDRAVRLYASGYYYTAKSKGMLGLMRNADSPPATPSRPAPMLAAAPPPPRPQQNALDALFRGSDQ
jgi:soluble lytic murein transglycosylase-like protein